MPASTAASNASPATASMSVVAGRRKVLEDGSRVPFIFGSCDLSGKSREANPARTIRPGNLQGVRRGPPAGGDIFAGCVEGGAACLHQSFDPISVGQRVHDVRIGR